MVPLPERKVFYRIRDSPITIRDYLILRVFLPIQLLKSHPKEIQFLRPRVLSLDSRRKKKADLLKHVPFLTPRVNSNPQSTMSQTIFTPASLHPHPLSFTTPQPFPAPRSPRHRFLAPAVSAGPPRPHLPSQCSRIARHTSSGPGS